MCQIRFIYALNMERSTIKINTMNQTKSYRNETMNHFKKICKTNTSFIIKSSIGELT